MAINIQNIIDQITAKAAAADSTDTADYLLTLSKATLAMNNATGVIEYRAKSELPTVDSSILGNFAYIAGAYDIDSVYGDSYAGFYYAARIGSNDSGWDRIITGADSDAAAFTPYSFQGSTSGYVSGGGNAGGGSNTIQTYSFASDANATDHGDLVEGTTLHVGNSSTSYGYTSGGNTDGPGGPQPNWYTNSITKFPFSSASGSTDVGDLTYAKREGSPASNEFYGYDVGSGSTTAPNNPLGAANSVVGNMIEKFSFSTDGNSTDVGDLIGSSGSYGSAGSSSETHGYSSGGFPPYRNIIEKFSFSVDGNSTDVGDLTNAANDVRGHSSPDNGYRSGGANPALTPPYINVIDKFPFSTDANATDVGDLTVYKAESGTSSSKASGYSAGGFNIGPPNVTYNVIDKFPFSTDANATDVGDLTVALRQVAGHQV